MERLPSLRLLTLSRHRVSSGYSSGAWTTAVVVKETVSPYSRVCVDQVETEAEGSAHTHTHTYTQVQLKAIVQIWSVVVGTGQGMVTYTCRTLGGPH